MIFDRNCGVILAVSVLLAGMSHRASAAQAQKPSLALIPMPREVQQQRSIPLHGNIEIRSSSDDDDKFAAADLAASFLQSGIKKSARGAEGPVVELLRLDSPRSKSILERNHLEFTPAMREEGYILVGDGDAVYDMAATSAGIFNGVQTLKQLIEGSGHNATLRTVIVRDWPAMKYRGQDDDLSRGPLHTLEYEKKLIRTLAAYKLNIYSPYFESTFHFDSDPLPSPLEGSMTHEEARELVRYAQQYHITIVPQQEAFGHLHHVLEYERYNDLAETPHGAVLAPGETESLKLIARWYGEIAETFPGPLIHIGADETDDLGHGKTEQQVARRGLGPVYVDFLRQIHDTLQPLHRRLLFWGDVAMNSPELVATLPKDMIAVAWQYDPPPRGFDRFIVPFTKAGIETWVSPSANRGTRIDPDNANNLATIQQFVAAGQRLGATGMLNTVWADGGEGIFEQDWYSILFGAAASWQQGAGSITDFEDSYGSVFHNDRSGSVDQAQIELMQAHETLAKAGLYAKNTLFWEDPWSSNGQRDTAKILPIVHDLRLHAEAAIVLIEEARRQQGIRNTDALDAIELGARRFDFIGLKFQQAQAIAQEYNAMYAVRNDKSAHERIMDRSYDISGVEGQCQDLRDGYGLIRDLFQAAWLKENRPYWLDNVLAEYDLNIQLWIRRGRELRAAADEFDVTGELLSPQSLGVPASIANAEKQ